MSGAAVAASVPSAVAIVMVEIAAAAPAAPATVPAFPLAISLPPPPSSDVVGARKLPAVVCPIDGGALTGG